MILLGKTNGQNKSNMLRVCDSKNQSLGNIQRTFGTFYIFRIDLKIYDVDTENQMDGRN